MRGEHGSFCLYLAKSAKIFLKKCKLQIMALDIFKGKHCISRILNSLFLVILGSLAKSCRSCVTEINRYKTKKNTGYKYSKKTSLNILSQT